MIELVQQKIKEKYPDAIINTEQQYDFPILILKKETLYQVLTLLKEDKELNFHFLTTLCGIHYPDNSIDTEFALMYQLHNMQKKWHIRIKTFMPKTDLKVPSVTTIWATANWMERQEYDFFGFEFENHPNLTRILNMDEMNYFPMRKEYPLEDLLREDKDDKMFGR